MNNQGGRVIFFCMETLDKACRGKIYQICGFNAAPGDPILRRFLELGLTCGERVKIVATSIQKKVMLLEVRSYTLSVRRGLLSKIEVKA